MNHHNFGILTENALCYMRTLATGEVEPKRISVGISTMAHIGDVYDLAQAHKLNQVWVHVSQETWEKLPDAFSNAPGYDISPVDTETHQPKSLVDVAHFMVVNKRLSGDRPLIGIGFLQHETSDWLPDAASTNQVHKYSGIPVKDVYMLFSYLEHLTGLPMHHGTGRIGQELIKKVNQGSRSEYLAPCTLDLDDFKSNIDPLSSWHRSLTPDEQEQGYLIQVDKNADYLAASNIQLGYGDYELVHQPGFNVQLPGIWHISIEGTSLFDDNQLPLASSVLKTGRGWVYSSMVKMLQELGYQVTIHEAKLWPKERHTRILGQWQEVLSNAYTAIRTDTDTYSYAPSRELAKEAVRGMYIKALSWFSMDRMFEDSKVISRPDWYGSIISDARQRMIRNIITHKTASGLTPVIVVRDGLWYVANQPDIKAILPDLRMETKPGHYKQVYSLPLASCKHLFTGDIPTTTVLHELKKIAKEYKHA